MSAAAVEPKAIERLIGIKAEGKSLEAITKPITSTEEPATAGV